MSEIAYDYKEISDKIKESAIDIESYKYNQRLLFGDNSKLSTYDKGILIGYTIAMDSKRDTYLREEMFIMADTSINNEMIIGRIDKIEDKLNNKIDEKNKDLDEKISNIKDIINNIDKRTVKIETLMITTNKTIEGNHENVVNKLNEISSSISKMNDRLLVIETEAKVKETTKDRFFRQFLLPIMSGVGMFLLTKVLIKFFP